jgi:hypothetical protein
MSAWRMRVGSCNMATFRVELTKTTATVSSALVTADSREEAERKAGEVSHWTLVTQTVARKYKAKERI